jgi:hypothetical protein
MVCVCGMCVEWDTIGGPAATVTTAEAAAAATCSFFEVAVVAADCDATAAAAELLTWTMRLMSLDLEIGGCCPSCPW